jgi:protein-tyrosine-phosphatase
MEGTPATPEAVAAARDLRVDIASHRARRLTDAMIGDADLLVGMAAEHREEIQERVLEVADQTFTLKELTRLLERDGASSGVVGRVAAAADARANGALTEEDRFDEDVVDPLGMPLETYRAIAWELQVWTERLAVALLGPVVVPAEGS